MSHGKHFMRNGWHILCFQGVYQVPMSKYHANLVDLLKPGEAKTAGNARKPVLTYRAAVLWQPRLQSGAGCSDSWGVRLPALIGITICSTGKIELRSDRGNVFWEGCRTTRSGTNMRQWGCTPESPLGVFAGQARRIGLTRGLTPFDHKEGLKSCGSLSSSCS